DGGVLGHFGGPGATGAPAKLVERRVTGIERNRTCAGAARKRIAAVDALPAGAIASFVTAREAPRVPFTALIERGMIMPGALLCDAERKVKALVRADGAVALGAKVASVHPTRPHPPPLSPCP